ncbi:hypothetical protein E1161_18945 [Saccharopolyspora aridisoli]|uniref:AI-2E family transporter n=1 Tax=Saccharopolyspora aridisoli TaxID=2530385 RepID=A0A4R4UG31_9PSEU|nr:hypothetical protein [Saccharopolyspora aridisoli]TDC90390.1 hypothetical protein E1161_18945 [Saccharopolyspora aridisoli]
MIPRRSGLPDRTAGLRRTVELSSLGVFVAILVGGALAGVLGAMLALPVAAALEGLFRHAQVEIRGSAT